MRRQTPLVLAVSLATALWAACDTSDDNPPDPGNTASGGGSDEGSDGSSADGAGTGTGTGGGSTGDVTEPGEPDWGICWNVPSTPASTCEEHCGAGRCAVDACDGLTWMWWDLDGALACGTQDFSSPVMTGHGCDDKMPGWDGSQNSFAVCCCLLPYPDS